MRMEIVVDAYDEVERALGWYYYIKDNIQVRFFVCYAAVISASFLLASADFCKLGNR